MEGETNGGGSGLKEIDKKVEEGDLNATNKQQANSEESVKPNEPIKMSNDISPPPSLFPPSRQSATVLICECYF